MLVEIGVGRRQILICITSMCNLFDESCDNR